MLSLFLESFWSYSVAIMPWFIIGIVLAVVIEKKINHTFIKKYFSTLTYKKLISAQVMGMVSPLSIMSFIPIANELVKLGANPGLLFSFFIAERAYDLQAFFVIASLFGLKMATLNALAIFISLVVTALYLKKQNLKIIAPKENKEKPFWIRQGKLIATVFIGISIGAGLRATIPESFVVTYAGGNAGGTLSALVMGFSFYFGPILGNYPVGRSFMDLGMAKMGVLTFLTVSPIFNFIIITLFSSMVGFRKTIPSVLIYTLVGIITSVGFGLFL